MLRDIILQEASGIKFLHVCILFDSAFDRALVPTGELDLGVE